MNDAIFDIQNMRKSILNCIQNYREPQNIPDDGTGRLFVKSLCGFMGVLSDFEMIYLGKKFNLLDNDTLAMNLDMVKARIASMFADPCPADDTPVSIEGPAPDADLLKNLTKIVVVFGDDEAKEQVLERFKAALYSEGC